MKRTYAQSLASVADEILRLDDRGRPRQAVLRRSLSTAYYALFHRLAEIAADLSVGASARPMRHVVARAFEHTSARELCQRIAHGQVPPLLQSVIGAIPRDLDTVATVFLELQAQRHRADYDPSVTFRKPMVSARLAEMRVAIAHLDRASMSPELAAFVQVLPLWSQLRRR